MLFDVSDLQAIDALDDERACRIRVANVSEPPLCAVGSGLTVESFVVRYTGTTEIHWRIVRTSRSVSIVSTVAITRLVATFAAAFPQQHS